MLVLTATTDKISLTTSKAGNVHVVACYTDRNQSNGAIGIDGRQVTSIVTAATTDIVGVPGSTTERNIRALHICNANTHGQGANGDNTITVNFDANGTIYEVYRATLAAGEILQYAEGKGFGIQNVAAKFDRTFVTTSDQISNSGSFEDITGFAVDLSPGAEDVTPPTYEGGKRYNFLAHIFHISGVTTTGFLLGTSGPTPQSMRVCVIDCIGGTANTAGTLASGTTLSPGQPIISETTGVAVVAMAILSGFFVMSGDANPGTNFRLSVASEVSANVTVKRGSWFRIWEAERTYE